MSIESARAFIEKLKTDQLFYRQVATCKDRTARMDLIISEGFDCTEDEIKSAAAELSDDQLENLTNAGHPLLSCANPIEYRHGGAPPFSSIPLPNIWH